MPSFQSLIISHTNFRKNPKTIMKSPSARISSNIVFSLRTDCIVKRHGGLLRVVRSARQRSCRPSRNYLVSSVAEEIVVFQTLHCSFV